MPHRYWPLEAYRIAAASHSFDRQPRMQGFAGPLEKGSGNRGGLPLAAGTAQLTSGGRPCFSAAAGGTVEPLRPPEVLKVLQTPGFRGEPGVELLKRAGIVHAADWT